MQNRGAENVMRDEEMLDMEYSCRDERCDREMKRGDVRWNAQRGGAGTWSREHCCVC
jgi:hypothetical protein